MARLRAAAQAAVTLDPSLRATFPIPLTFLPRAKATAPRWPG